MKAATLARSDAPRARANDLELFRRCIASFIACALLNGCMTTESFNTLNVDAARLSTIVHPGDQVSCAMRDGSYPAFKVTAVEPGVIVGDSHRVALADIMRIDIIKFSGRKTAAAGATVVVAAALVLVGTAPWEPMIEFGYP